MKRSYLLDIIFFAVVTLLVSECAKQASPTGGPKDETPPKILKSIPVSGTRNFKGKEIAITFDEYVAFDNLNEKFMISPPVKDKPDIFLRGKTLYVRFLEDLRENTTYTLYFQDAVKDLNEGNPYSNLQFVFSTGNVIDSLSLTGNVLLADNLEAGEKVLILLHSELADSAPRKKIPDYITLADINGGFRIDNLKEGKYRLYALTDKNNNKRFDLADEQFAFLDSVIEVNSLRNWLPVRKDTTPVVPDLKPLKPGEKKKRIVPLIAGQHKLFLFTEDPKKSYLTSSTRRAQYLLEYTLSLPPRNQKFEVRIDGSSEENIEVMRSRQRDTMKVWLYDTSLYMQPVLKTFLTYPFTDSTGTDISRTDTVTMRAAIPRAVRGRVPRTPMKFNINLSGSSLAPGQKVLLTATTPVVLSDTSKIRVYETDQKAKTRIPLTLKPDTSDRRKILFDTKLTPGKAYFFTLESGALRNRWGEYTDSTAFGFSVRTPDSYGNLTLRITGVPCNIIIQLLDTKEAVIAEKKISADGKVEFPLLDKGFYRLRAIYDLNKDGKWTTGDFSTGRQPEPVSYLPKEAEVKVLWNVEEEWDISTMNFKDLKLKVSKDS